MRRGVRKLRAHTLCKGRYAIWATCALLQMRRHAKPRLTAVGTAELHG